MDIFLFVLLFMFAMYLHARISVIDKYDIHCKLVENNEFKYRLVMSHEFLLVL